MTGLLWEILDPILKALRPPSFAKPPAPPPVPTRRRQRSQLRKVRDASSEGTLPFHSRPSTAALAKPGSVSAPPLIAPSVALAKPGDSAVQSPKTDAPRAQGMDLPRIENAPPTAPAPADSMQEKYDAVVAYLLEKHQVRVRKWRKSMSGIAWYVEYRDGTRKRLIESPKPKGPMSIAVFLHEIGHHAIGFDVYKPRCLEEYHAWRWALEAMAEHNLNITDQVRLRVHRSLHYAVQKAKRRGIKKIPVELEPYLTKPPSRRRRD